MSIYPTRTAAHLSIAGVVVLAVGVAIRQAEVVAWGGAMLVAIAVARSVTLVSVMRIRAAGFEMLWTGTERVARVRCGSVVELEAEVRNRDTLSARYDKLRVVASPGLRAELLPLAGEVHATGSVTIRVRVHGLRVGHHGIFGLALEVRGAPGLFEVPLTFANPFGVEVLPRALSRSLSLPHGGRSLTVAAAGRSGRRRGDGTELHELREHLHGDAFRRIAWKASARRGVLVVKEFEREERDVVMLVLDASVELWAGAMGQAPLDDAIDTIATLASVHLGRGDLVGLRIVSTRELAAVAPAAGRSHASEISRVLAHRTGVLDADRSAWDEAEVAAQVSEHMRPLEPKAATDLRLGRLDRLVKRASAVRAHAPFTLDPPYGRSDRDVRLRSYAASFGMHFPARLEPDRPRSCQVLADTLGSVSRVKPSVSMVHVVAPVPTDDTLAAFRTAMRRLRGQRVGVRWSTVPLVGPAAGGEVGRPEERSPDPELAQGPHLDGALFELLDRAVRVRVTAAQRRGERALRGMGVKLVAVGRSARHDDAPRSPRDAA